MRDFDPVRFDKYLLLDRIAVGGMAEVFRAKRIGEQGFEKPVVLKKMLPHLMDQEEMVSSFVDEARLASFLNHKNIIDIYDFGQESGTFFIAMEYLFGKDVQQIIKRAAEMNRPIDIEDALYIILKVCEGLEYAHKLKGFDGKPLNIIHRDVSPHNIFITYEGQIKLLDFGIAKAASKSTKTQTGIIKGKVAYMSPEQAEGRNIDYRSDIFAIGIILYELVTQKKMFEGDTFQVLSKVIQVAYEPPENIVTTLPDKLYDIIHKSLKKAPEDRYQSCGEMATEIEMCINESGYHPSSKKLAGYMQSLFDGLFEIEARQMADAMTRGVGCGPDSPPPADLAGKTERIENITDLHGSVEVQKTVAIQKDHSALIRTLKQKGRIFSEVTKNKFDSARTLGSNNKKIKLMTGIITVLIISVITIGYLYRPLDENELRIRRLLEQAEQRMDEDKIILPERDSSFYFYQEVLAIDSENKSAAEGLNTILDKCIQSAEVEIENSNLSLARKYVITGLKIDPENERLLELRRKTAIGPRLLLDKLRNVLQPSQN